jgi:cytoskeletal protein CcmA (bactofilin family)
MADEQELSGLGKPNTFIGKGSEFVGKLTFDGTVRIDGKIDGEIFSRGILIVGPDAEVSAKIQVDTVYLSGLVRGNITAGKKIVMKSPGKLYGNIKTPVLVVEEGVIFEGNCKMEGSGAAEGAAPELKLGARDKEFREPPLPRSE